MAVETLGSWGDLSKKFVEDIGCRIASSTGEKRSKSYLFQSISVAVQRGNAAAIMGTLPRGKKLDEIYNLY